MENKIYKRIFVAGSSGMVGRAIVKKIHERLPESTCVAASFTQKNLSTDCHFVQLSGDLRDAEVCYKLTADCDAAILAAASTGGILQNSTEPWKQVNDNLVMNAFLLEALVRNNVKRIIMIGSATCYQSHSGFIQETHLDWNIDPPSTYLGIGWVSRYLEKLCQFWHEKTGVEIIFIRAANIYGPYAKFDPQTSNFIPALIRKIEKKPDVLNVLGSPNIERDVIYVNDFADACISLLKATNIKYDIFNVGSGRATTVAEVVDNLIQISDSNDTKIDYEENENFSTKGRILNCHKIQNVVGWTPQYSLRNGLQETYHWWEKNKDAWKR